MASGNSEEVLFMPRTLDFCVIILLTDFFTNGIWLPLICLDLIGGGGGGGGVYRE